MHTPKLIGAAVFAAVLALAGTAAVADTFYNDLENPISVDALYETMNLTYDTPNSTGTSGSTIIALQVDNHPDHQGCNIQGGPHYVALNASSSDESVATVSLANDGVFNDCDSTILATVTSHSVGTADITFAVDSARTNNDPALTFSVVEAAFQVNVTEGTTQPPTGCDADPAAPAWAAAILQKSNTKLKATQIANYVSRIAGEMGTGATFQNIVKNAHPAYENAVHDRLEVLTGKTLVSAQLSARPGWVCTTL